MSQKSERLRLLVLVFLCIFLFDFSVCGTLHFSQDKRVFNLNSINLQREHRKDNVDC